MQPAYKHTVGGGLAQGRRRMYRRSRSVFVQPSPRRVGVPRSGTGEGSCSFTPCRPYEIPLPVLSNLPCVLGTSFGDQEDEMVEGVVEDRQTLIVKQTPRRWDSVRLPGGCGISRGGWSAGPGEESKVGKDESFLGTLRGTRTTFEAFEPAATAVDGGLEKLIERDHLARAIWELGEGRT
jgi:hypothetical protein